MRVNGMDAVNTLASTEPKISGLKIAEGAIDKSISLLSDQEKMELPVSQKVVVDAIEKANRAVESFAYTSFEYSVHEKTGTVMVKVIDRDTKQVIREIPPEKMLDLVAKLWELSGILVDERR